MAANARPKILDVEDLEEDICDAIESARKVQGAELRSKFTKFDQAFAVAVPMVIARHIAERVELRLQLLEEENRERVSKSQSTSLKLLNELTDQIKVYVDTKTSPTTPP